MTFFVADAEQFFSQIFEADYRIWHFLNIHYYWIILVIIYLGNEMSSIKILYRFSNMWTDNEYKSYIWNYQII